MTPFTEIDIREVEDIMSQVKEGHDGSELGIIEAALMATLTMPQKALPLLGDKPMGMCIVVMICDDIQGGEIGRS